ncbi:MAG: glycosyltransferase family 4 protein [Candidatus Omnitrophica bacterium]|nr:glycosyltransferase family 4 protein [Candidatus Omnitrophota bacterium]
MRILHLTSHLDIGGITSVVLTLTKGFTRMGHEVAILSGGGSQIEALQTAGATVHTLPIRTKNEFSPKIFFALPKVIRLVREEKFDLLHAHTRAAQVLAALVSLFTKTPVVTTAHGFYKRRLSRRIMKGWGKRVVAISPLVAEELEKTHKVPRSKIRIIYNGLDVADFRKRLMAQNSEAVKRELGIPEDSFVIGSISRLVKDKGQHVLIEAVKKLSRKNDHFFLVIVGDGREKSQLEGLVKKLGLNRRAIFLPARPDITDILSVLDVFVHPATFREGFGLTLLEAMTAKLPVIATDIWAVNTIIRNGVNGYLVDPRNPEELAKAIELVMRNPETAGSVAENAFEICSRLYSAERMASELETVYNEAINVSSRARERSDRVEGSSEG